MTLLTTFAALLACAAPPEDDALARALDAMNAAEKATVSIEATNADAAGVIERLNAMHFVPVHADWGSLKRIGVEPDDKITINVRNVTLLDAAQALAHAMGSDIERPIVDAAPGQVVITTPFAAKALQQTAIYDIADIISDPTVLAGDAPSDAGTTAPVDDDVAVRMQRCVDLITDHIDSDGWNTNAGSRGTLSTDAARLIVSATPRSHRAIRALLDNLRRESPVAANVGITLIDVPKKTLATLEKDAKGDASALALALGKCDDARRGWSPRVVARLDEEASIESKDAAGGGMCTLVAKHDRIAGILSVALELKVQEGGTTASFKGVLPFPHGAGEVAVVLPTGPGADRTWVLVVNGREAKRE